MHAHENCIVSNRFESFLLVHQHLPTESDIYITVEVCAEHSVHNIVLVELSKLTSYIIDSHRSNLERWSSQRKSSRKNHHLPHPSDS